MHSSVSFQYKRTSSRSFSAVSSVVESEFSQDDIDLAYSFPLFVDPEFETAEDVVAFCKAELKLARNKILTASSSSAGGPYVSSSFFCNGHMCRFQSGLPNTSESQHPRLNIAILHDHSPRSEDLSTRELLAGRKGIMSTPRFDFSHCMGSCGPIALFEHLSKLARFRTGAEGFIVVNPSDHNQRRLFFALHAVLFFTIPPTTLNNGLRVGHVEPRGLASGLELEVSRTTCRYFIEDLARSPLADHLNALDVATALRDLLCLTAASQDARPSSSFQEQRSPVGLILSLLITSSEERISDDQVSRVLPLMRSLSPDARFMEVLSIAKRGALLFSDEKLRFQGRLVQAIELLHPSSDESTDGRPPSARQSIMENIIFAAFSRLERVLRSCFVATSWLNVFYHYWLSRARSNRSKQALQAGELSLDRESHRLPSELEPVWLLVGLRGLLPLSVRPFRPRRFLSGLVSTESLESLSDTPFGNLQNPWECKWLSTRLVFHRNPTLDQIGFCDSSVVSTARAILNQHKARFGQVRKDPSFGSVEFGVYVAWVPRSSPQFSEQFDSRDEECKYSHDSVSVNCLLGAPYANRASPSIPLSSIQYFIGENQCVSNVDFVFHSRR